MAKEKLGISQILWTRIRHKDRYEVTGVRSHVGVDIRYQLPSYNEEYSEEKCPLTTFTNITNHHHWVQCVRQHVYIVVLNSHTTLKYQMVKPYAPPPLPWKPQIVWPNKVWAPRQLYLQLPQQLCFGGIQRIHFRDTSIILYIYSCTQVFVYIWAKPVCVFLFNSLDNSWFNFVLHFRHLNISFWQY